MHISINYSIFMILNLWNQSVLKKIFTIFYHIFVFKNATIDEGSFDRKFSWYFYLNSWLRKANNDLEIQKFVDDGSDLFAENFWWFSIL